MDKRDVLADLTRIDFQRPNRIRLGTSYSFSVGGIGDVRQTAFRFKSYRYDQVKRRIIPDYDLRDLATWNQKHDISGQDLLVSLMNLYDSINRPTVNDIPYTEQIIQWCVDHFHPYHYDEMMAEIAVAINDSGYNGGFELLDELAQNESDGLMSPLSKRLLNKVNIVEAASFDVIVFMQDLSTLCDAFTCYLAIAANERGDAETIERMIYEGKQYSIPSFLNQFIAPDGHYRRVESLSEDTLDDFAYMFPTMQLKLQYMKDEGVTIIAPVVNSVFDTCWYALSCMAAAAESEGYGRGRYRFIRCKCCNQLISAYGQQKYCQSTACQAFRNSQKMQAHRSKKKRLKDTENE